VVFGPFFVGGGGVGVTVGDLGALAVAFWDWLGGVASMGAKSAMARGRFLIRCFGACPGCRLFGTAADYERQKLPRKVDSRAVDRSNTPSLQKYLMAR